MMKRWTVTRKATIIRVIVSLLGAACLVIAAAISCACYSGNSGFALYWRSVERIILWDQVAKYALPFAILGILLLLLHWCVQKK